MSSRRTSISAAANAVAEKMTGRAEREAVRLPIAQIRRDGGTQPRTGLDPATVAEYAEVIHNGGKLPPAELVYDGTNYWLWDGYHRLAAALEEGETDYEFYVRPGMQRDAVLLSVGANADHGLRRTNEDKRRAVETLLHDAEWSKWSDREIARVCKVSNWLVSSIRAGLSVRNSQIDGDTPQKRLVRRGDQVYEQDISNLQAPRQEQVDDEGEALTVEQERAARWLRGTHFEQRKDDERDAILESMRTRILAALEDGPKRAIELRAALGDPAPAPFRIARERLKDEGLIIENTPSDGRISYHLATDLSVNSSQIDSPETALSSPSDSESVFYAEVAAALGDLIEAGDKAAMRLWELRDIGGPLPEWLPAKLNEVQAVLYGHRRGDHTEPGLTDLLEDLYARHFAGKGKGR